MLLSTEAVPDINKEYKTNSGAKPVGGWGVDSIELLSLLYVLGQTDLSKQCWPRSDAAELGVRSGSTLFATSSAILHTLTCNKTNLLKRSIR